MKKLFLMRNPELFQGQEYIDKNKNYFEGWYFKNTHKKDTISFIPGISIDSNDKKAFIQIITNKSSYFIDYDIKDFEYSHDPFYVKIKDNIFSKEGIHIDIEDSNQNIKVCGDIEYFNSINIKTSSKSPNIMGPFSYIPFMECNHAILCMKNNIKGYIKINNKKINLNNGIGYIEKDWGTSFPKSYIWIQGNKFKSKKVSFMLSIADIPFKIFSFRGVIADLIIGDKEYKFTTYNKTKITKCEVNDKNLDITLKRGKYELNIKSSDNNGNKLIAPVKGKMAKDIIESVTSIISVTLRKGKDIIFSDTSNNCGLEIVD